MPTGVAFAGPLLLCAALAPGTDGRRRRHVLGVALAMLVWQWWAPVRETIKGAVDPSAQAAYYRPLVSFVDARAEGAVRVEVPFTRLHWESVYVARSIPLARGWVTQLDRKYNALFRPGSHSLNPARYRAWLDREGVRYVALPDVALDPSGRGEARLIRAGLPFLRPVFEDRHWQIFEVLGTPGLADGAGAVTRIRPQSFDLRSRRAGFTLVRIRYTPYWRVASGRGCVLRARGGWTLVYALRAGPLRIDTAFDPRRLLDGAARCSQGAAAARGTLSPSAGGRGRAPLIAAVRTRSRNPPDKGHQGAGQTRTTPPRRRLRSFLHMTDWLRTSRPGRALRWRAQPEWAWLSLQLLALFLTTRVGHLIGSLSWPARVAVLIPVVLILFGIADIVADKVDERVDAVPVSEHGPRG